MQELDESIVSSYLSIQKCQYSSEPATWKYSCFLFYLLNHVLENVDLNSEAKSKGLSMNQLNAIVHAVQECSTSALEICVKKHKSRIIYHATDQSDEEYHRLVGCLRMFSRLFNVKIISSNSLFDDTKLDYIVGILAVISLKKDPVDVSDFLQLLKNIRSSFSTELVFKFLMMTKGFRGLSKEFQGIAHTELMHIIRSPKGFYVLCKNLLVKPEDDQVYLWQKWAMISKITEAVISNKRFQKFLIKEIFKTLDASIKNDDRDLVGACVYVLKNLEAKNDVELKDLIHSAILDPLNELTQPDVLLFGSIVMENHELKEMINRLHVIFSSSSTIESLPSITLQKHIRLLFNLYTIVPESPESEKLSSTIVFFLRNRQRNELQNIIQDFRLKDNEATIKIHQRICYKNESLQVGGEQDGIIDDTDSFLSLLKNSNNNFLVYDVFLCLINILSHVQSSGDNFLSEYNVSEEDLPGVLHRKFSKKLAILEPLQEMIQWNSLYSQLNEKPKDVLMAIKSVLEKSVESSDSMDEQLMLIFFSIFKELIHKLRDEDQKKQMEQEVLKIKEICKNPKLRKQLDSIFSVMEENPSIDPSKLAFDDAMKLLSSSEIYIKAYGTDTLIKLLRKRDEQTVLNRHTILAVALQNLREKESFAYLKITKLLVTLTLVMDSEVIEALVAEYQNKELDIDERLKTGEVIVKVTEDLGQMSVKFKEPLIKCFLSGSRDENNEYRTSNLANLGRICKILSYQIHNFFREMFQQLEIIIKGDNYLPSKRAAAMVLSDILAGLPNLMDFQDYLLPIYHLLKDILANEADPQTRLHAEIALDHLNAKTKDFLNPKLKVAKEIKIRLDENPNKLNEIKFK